MEEDTQSSGLGESQQNLNDLQSYLVNFNKEIGVHGEGSAFHHSVSQIISQSTQPVFVTLPVSSESTTPDEEQLPVLGCIKVEKSPELEDSDNIGVGEDNLDDDAENGQTEEALGTVVVDSQMEGLEPERIELHELSLDQLDLHHGIAMSDGKEICCLQTQGSHTNLWMVMLPMGDACNILSQSVSPRIAQVQIVNINGQPTLQLVDPSIFQHQLNNTVSVSEGQTIVSLAPSSVLPSLNDSSNQLVLTSVDATNPVAVLASVAANTNSVNQLQASQVSGSIQILPQETQLVAMRDGADVSHSQVNTMSYDDEENETGAVDLTQEQQTAALLKKNTGYQSVAILPTGDPCQQEVNYVLIVNPAGDKDNVQGSVYDFGDNVTGEIIEEMTDENGTTKRLVKISQLVAKSNEISAREVAPADQLACTHCDYTSPKKYLLSRHMKSHCDDRPHKCGLCHRGFKTMSSLQNHINTHAGVRPHKCKLCESAFTTSGELIRHVRYKHTFEKPHKCTECEYASVELSKLKRHMRSHTGERPYACSYCNYASPDTYKLKRHLRIHTGEKPYECDVCHAKFTQSNSLKAHKLIHSGNKPVFKCVLCPTTCGRKTDLKVHMMKLHSSDQPLVCKKCGESFPDRYTFKVHFKSHDGEKCFKCPECDYSAISQRHVDSHMLVHSGLKPYECEDCDLAFRQKALLKRHRNVYHNPDYNPDNSEDKSDPCRACEKSLANKNKAENMLNISQQASDDREEMDDSDSELTEHHTCGGYSKTSGELIMPLTADQLIENSLLADMKQGKLGTSPKVVVVHPDGRVEEVTAKLQSLSQSKPMDDFLVSLGVSGDSHFDQVSSLPSDVTVSEVNSLVSSKEDSLLEHQDGDDHSNIRKGMESNSSHMSEDSSHYHAGSLIDSFDIDHTKEESTQASFDSDSDDNKKVKVMSQEQFLSLSQSSDSTELQGCFEDTEYRIIHVDQPIIGNVPQIVVSMLAQEEHGSAKRGLEVAEEDEESNISVGDDDHLVKRLRTDLTET